MANVFANRFRVISSIRMNNLVEFSSIDDPPPPQSRGKREKKLTYVYR